MARAACVTGQWGVGRAARVVAAYDDVRLRLDTLRRPAVAPALPGPASTWPHAAAAVPVVFAACGAGTGPAPADPAPQGRSGPLATHSTKPRHTRPARPHAAKSSAASVAAHGAGAAEPGLSESTGPGGRGSLNAFS